MELLSFWRLSSRRFKDVRFSTVLSILTLLDPAVGTGALASCEIVVKVPCRIWLKTGFFGSGLKVGLVGWDVRVEKKGWRGPGETG